MRFGRSGLQRWREWLLGGDYLPVTIFAIFGFKIRTHDMESKREHYTKPRKRTLVNIPGLKRFDLL